MKVAGLQWDHANWPKCGKHGVSREEIEFVFAKGLPRVAPDLRHSQSEDRFIAVGRTPAGRALFVGFTFRSEVGRLLIRPVTARYMHEKEASRYGEQGSENDYGS